MIHAVLHLVAQLFGRRRRRLHRTHPPLTFIKH